MKLIFVLFGLALTLFHCSEDPKTEIFQGITETNEVGQLVGFVDENDWLLDENWDSVEIGLFQDLGLPDINNEAVSETEKKRIIDSLKVCLPNGRVSSVCEVDELVSPAYPNPAQTSFGDYILKGHGDVRVN
jgi:hypothetical protein